MPKLLHGPAHRRCSSDVCRSRGRCRKQRPAQEPQERRAPRRRDQRLHNSRGFAAVTCAAETSGCTSGTGIAASTGGRSPPLLVKPSGVDLRVIDVSGGKVVAALPLPAVGTSRVLAVDFLLRALVPQGKVQQHLLRPSSDRVDRGRGGRGSRRCNGRCSRHGSSSKHCNDRRGPRRHCCVVGRTSCLFDGRASKNITHTVFRAFTHRRRLCFL